MLIYEFLCLESKNLIQCEINEKYNEIDPY